MAIVEDARNAYRAGSNDMQKGAARPARGREVCRIVGGTMKVDRWQGKISKLSTNGDGLGVLAVEIGPQINIGTWNNSLSDIGTHTLIDSGSPIFQAAASLAVGRAVEVSGTLFQSPGTDCVIETSVTLDGSMRSPDYLLRFTSLRPLD